MSGQDTDAAVSATVPANPTAATPVAFRLGLAPIGHPGTPALEGLLELHNSGAAVPTAVAQALALEAALPLLAALELHLGHALGAVEPLAATSAPALHGRQDVLTWQLPGLGRLLLPAAALRPGVALLPAGLRAVWPTIGCTLVLDRIAAARIAADTLAETRLLLLPGSFGGFGASGSASTPGGAGGNSTPGETWPILARPALPWPLLGGLAWWPARARLHLTPRLASDARDAGDLWELVSPLPCRISAACWFDATPAEPNLPAPPAAALLRRAGRTWAEGSLVPVGLGWGLMPAGQAPGSLSPPPLSSAQPTAAALAKTD